MNCTVVIPILNEERSIKRVLEALAKQTLLPSEVILVDGGSRDKTAQIIKDYALNSSFSLEMILKPKSNRSQARNTGIDKAQNQIIAVTDAGSYAKKDWLEKLLAPFKDQRVDAVAGYYSVNAKNGFEEAVADFVAVREWNFDAGTFLPSSRSFAFRKSLWKKVGGYPEELSTCEDLVFAQKMREASVGWKVVRDAQVIWEHPKSIDQLHECIFGYAIGDLKAQYERHLKKIYSAMWRLGILLFLALPLSVSGLTAVRTVGLGLFGLYIAGSWGKHFRVLRYPLNLLWLPVLQLTVDTALFQAFLFHKMTNSSSQRK